MESQTPFEDRRTSSDILRRIWDDSWKNNDIVESIRNIRKDENLRWKLKFAPCNGRFVEAGSGVGQYVFYFRELGFDIEGIDISQEAISLCKKFSEEHGYDPEMFSLGDVRNLDLKNDSISYYLSFGVIEHFQEGPMDALEEAYRVLRPGGLAYIATPQKYTLTRPPFSWLFIITEMPLRCLRKIKGKIFGNKSEEGWVENTWSLAELKTYVGDAGFIIVDAVNVGLKATFEINWRSSRRNLNKLLNKIKPFLFPLLDKLEDTRAGRFGLNNVVIALKPGKLMYCFFCGEKHGCEETGLGIYSVPVCQSCISEVNSKVLEHYRLGNKPFFNKRVYTKSEVNVKIKKCTFCNIEIVPHSIIDDWGFSESVCINCLNDKEKSLISRNFLLKYDNS